MPLFRTIILVALLLTAGSAVHAQKKVIMRYSGGHGCIDITLYLYSDSTYKYEEQSALMMFNLRSASKGKYSLQDNLITLHRKKRLHFIYFKEENKYSPASFRVSDKKILLYTPNQAASKDSGYYKSYYTLYALD